MSKITSMQISDETLDKLHSLKQRGETYEDVIKRLLQACDDTIATEDYK